MFSTVFKYVFQCSKVIKSIFFAVFRQMEAANRLDEIRDTLNLSETDPIPQIVLDG